jgi:hypothetical protein
LILLIRFLELGFFANSFLIDAKINFDSPFPCHILAWSIKKSTMKKKKTHADIIQTASIAIALLLLCSLQGCKYYYKVQTVNKVTHQEVKKFDSLDKYIILHQRDKAWHFSKTIISNDTLYGALSVLPENRYKFQTTKPKGGNRYIKNKKPNETYVLEEVHVYVSDSVVPEKYDSGNIKIVFSKIQNAEVYVEAKGRTTASWLVPVIGGSVLAGGVLGGIILVVSLSQMNINLSH